MPFCLKCISENYFQIQLMRIIYSFFLSIQSCFPKTMSIRYDLPLIGATLFLLSWGTVMIYSTGGVFADLQYNDGQYFFYIAILSI